MGFLTHYLCKKKKKKKQTNKQERTEGNSFPPGSIKWKKIGWNIYLQNIYMTNFLGKCKSYKQPLTRYVPNFARFFSPLFLLFILFCFFGNMVRVLCSHSARGISLPLSNFQWKKIDQNFFLHNIYMADFSSKCKSYK